MSEGELLAGRVCLVTGGASGIGLAIVDAMLRVGARVAVFDLPGAAASTGLSRLAGLHAGLSIHEGDVRMAEDVRRAVACVVERFGAIHVLVNNAGIDPRPGGLCEMSEAMWEEVMGTNLKAAFLFSRECVPHFLKAGGGVIINNASAMATRTLPRTSAYSASKAGLIGFSKALAVEFAPDRIRVLSISPGPIDTPLMWSGVVADDLPRVRRHVDGSQPMKRIGSVEEVARVVLFLASDAASYLSGTNVEIDGAGSAMSITPQ